MRVPYLLVAIIFEHLFGLAHGTLQTPDALQNGFAESENRRKIEH